MFRLEIGHSLLDKAGENCFMVGEKFVVLTREVLLLLLLSVLQRRNTIFHSFKLRQNVLNIAATLRIPMRVIIDNFCRLSANQCWGDRDVENGESRRIYWIGCSHIHTHIHRHIDRYMSWDFPTLAQSDLRKTNLAGSTVPRVMNYGIWLIYGFIFGRGSDSAGSDTLSVWSKRGWLEGGGSCLFGGSKQQFEGVKSLVFNLKRKHPSSLRLLTTAMVFVTLLEPFTERPRRWKRERHPEGVWFLIEYFMWRWLKEVNGEIFSMARGNHFGSI